MGKLLLVSRAAKPWQGRTLEGSGGSGARFWTPAVLRGKVVTFGLEGRETVARAYLTPAVLRGRVITFGLEGREIVARAYFRGLWRAKRGRVVGARADMQAHAHAQRAPLAAHTNQHTRTHTHQPTPTNTHAYTHPQDCMSDDSSPRAKT